MIILAILLRGYAFVLFEKLVEIGLTDKATAGSNIHDTFLVVTIQFADDGIDPVFLQEVGEVMVGVLFEETGECGQAHAHVLGQFVYRDGVRQVLVEVVEDLFHLIVAFCIFR